MTAPMLSVVALLCYLTRYIPTATAELKTSADLDTFITDLRAGDYALVRPSPTDETIAKQKELCPNAIPKLVEFLSAKDSTMLQRAKSAESLALCTTNNPSNRFSIATTNEGKSNNVHSGLVSLIVDAMNLLKKNKERNDDVDIANKAIGDAAEAIWILSFASNENHEGFKKVGAFDKIGQAIIDCEEIGSDICAPRAIMWLFGSLQNNMASYCNTPDGPWCGWDWHGPDELRIIDEHASTLFVDSQDVRKEIMANDKVVDIMIKHACAGPVQFPHGEEVPVYDVEGLDAEDSIQTGTMTYAWPTRGVVKHGDESGDEYCPTITTWTAIGAISKLALIGDDTRKEIMLSEDIQACLCDHSHSPDWLQSLKSSDALNYLDIDCPPLYDEDSCTNHENWKEKEHGMTCEDYEEENLCVEYGENVDEDGRSANDACCICGGGFWTNDDDEGYGGEEL